MIKIFRKIRFNLLEQSKTGKYLKYAIGEIVLVVIGILIALQINNWNEERKYRLLESKILKDLQSDLTHNIDNLEEGIRRLKTGHEDNLRVLELYRQKTPYNDSLLPFFSDFLNQWDPDFTYAGFENLKSQGVNIISNPELRKDIINLVEVEMDILDHADMGRIDQLNSVLVLPMLKTYFYRDMSVWGNDLPFIPSNYDAMINDPEFYNICTEVAFRQRRSIFRFTKFNKSANDLISRIESEIKRIE